MIPGTENARYISDSDLFFCPLAKNNFLILHLTAPRYLWVPTLLLENRSVSFLPLICFYAFVCSYLTFDFSHHRHRASLATRPSTRFASSNLKSILNPLPPHPPLSLTHSLSLSLSLSRSRDSIIHHILLDETLKPPSVIEQNFIYIYIYIYNKNV